MFVRSHIVAAAALTAAVGFVAPAAPAAAETPFKSRLTAHAVFVPTSTPGVLAGTVSGAGHATHLGRVTLATTEIIDFASSPGTLLILDGRMVMVAANGDELRWSYSGTGTLPPDADGNIALSGTFVITGGTGRFSDASGSGTFTGVGGPSSASVYYLGTITY
jgi:hypothetical protein